MRFCYEGIIDSAKCFFKFSPGWGFPNCQAKKRLLFRICQPETLVPFANCQAKIFLVLAHGRIMDNGRPAGRRLKKAGLIFRDPPITRCRYERNIPCVCIQWVSSLPAGRFSAPQRRSRPRPPGAPGSGVPAHPPRTGSCLRSSCPPALPA